MSAGQDSRQGESVEKREARDDPAERNEPLGMGCGVPHTGSPSVGCSAPGPRGPPGDTRRPPIRSGAGSGEAAGGHRSTGHGGITIHRCGGGGVWDGPPGALRFASGWAGGSGPLDRHGAEARSKHMMSRKKAQTHVLRSFGRRTLGRGNRHEGPFTGALVNVSGAGHLSRYDPVTPPGVRFRWTNGGQGGGPVTSP